MSAPIGDEDWAAHAGPVEPQQPKGPPCRCCGGQRSVDRGGLLLCPHCDRVTDAPRRPRP